MRLCERLLVPRRHDARMQNTERAGGGTSELREHADTLLTECSKVPAPESVRLRVGILRLPVAKHSSTLQLINIVHTTSYPTPTTT